MQRIGPGTIKKRTRNAFTLAEVLVALSIVAVLFGSLYVGLGSGMAVTRAGREDLRATQILMEKIESVRLCSWSQLVYSNWVPSTFTTYYNPVTTSGQPSAGVVYTGSMVITNAVLNPSASYGTNLRAVTVTLNWNSANVAHTRTVTTYVSRYGLGSYVLSN